MNYPKPTALMLQIIAEELENPIDIFESITLLQHWESLSEKPKNLTLWVTEKLTLGTV